MTTSPLGSDPVTAFSEALEAWSGGATGASHHYPEVAPVSGGAPQAFAVSFFPDHNGLISVVCRPVAIAAAFGGTEADALDMILRAIKVALAERVSLRADLTCPADMDAA